MSQDKFLICCNCRNWGQPWIVQKKVIICEQKRDVLGSLYTKYHPACKHFVPVLTSMPEDLQKIRLFVQTLTPTQISYFAWSLSQISLLLGVKDSRDQNLSLGDQVHFRLGAVGHTGTVEGIDPHHKYAVIVNSPAFVNSSISLLASSLTKITKEKAIEFSDVPSLKNKEKVDWHIKSLIDEISHLRSKQDTWTKEEHRAVLLYEEQLQKLEFHKRQNSIQTSI